MSMNIFRLCGDMSHIISIVVLLLRLGVVRNAQGVSARTHELFLLVFVTRYLDLYTTFYSWYNSWMKLFYIASTASILYMVRFHESIGATYDKAQDTFPHMAFAVAPCAVLALITHLVGSEQEYFDYMELLWTFSIYLEAVAILPQLLVLQHYRREGDNLLNGKCNNNNNDNNVEIPASSDDANNKNSDQNVENPASQKESDDSSRPEVGNITLNDNVDTPTAAAATAAAVDKITPSHLDNKNPLLTPLLEADCEVGRDESSDFPTLDAPPSTSDNKSNTNSSDVADGATNIHNKHYYATAALNRLVSVFNYVFLMGLYRALYIVNWIYRANTERNYRHHWVVYFCGVVQTLLYADFFYHYIKSNYKGEKFTV